VRLVGAIGLNIQDRMQGHFGSGFYVISVDKLATVRVLFDPNFGTLLRVDGVDNLTESGCLYNEAFITLDAQVYGAGEFNQIKLGPIKVPKTPEEKTKALQKDLKLLGYYKGDIDGTLGAEILAAIERFKTDNQIARDTPLENIEGLIGLRAASRSLDELDRLYKEGSAPKPPLRR
jgi:putative peptidoglycan binding protein